MQRAASPPALVRDAQRLIDLLNALGTTPFRKFVWQKAAALELTYAQSQVLFHVAEHPGCTMGEVAKAYGVTLPAITHIVDRLEQRQLLTRTHHPADRRVYVLDVTPRGQAVARDLLATRLEAMVGVLRRMSARERALVVDGLEVLVDAAARAQGGGR
ncbi:MAG TPA: MarR family transcriptional regulator [Candidatus Tectomicrobia bacterium]|nr:MarR family transcriptional regulator [Candidatus Tectomicrobia bacterium]